MFREPEPVSVDPDAPGSDALAESDGRIWGALHCVLVGAVILGIGVFFLIQEVRMSVSGVTTVATVDRIEQHGKDRSAFITFDDTSGHSVGQQSVGVDRTVYAGDSLAVVYLPSDPSSVEPVSRQEMRPLLAAVATVGAVVMSWGIYLLRLKTRKQKPLGPLMAGPTRTTLTVKSYVRPVHRPMGKRERRRAAGR